MGTGSGGMRGHPVSRLDKRSWPCLAFPLPDLNPSCSLGHTNPKPCCPDAEERASCVKVVGREPRGVREHRAWPPVWRKWQQPGQVAPGSNDQTESHTSQGNSIAPNGHFHGMDQAPFPGPLTGTGLGWGAVFPTTGQSPRSAGPRASSPAQRTLRRTFGLEDHPQDRDGLSGLTLPGWHLDVAEEHRDVARRALQHEAAGLREAQPRPSFSGELPGSPYT